MKIKRLKLKRKWLIVITIVMTLCSLKLMNLFNNQIQDIKKIAEQCDISKGYTCSSYELRNYLINR